MCFEPEAWSDDANAELVRGQGEGSKGPKQACLGFLLWF
jgi:hypothetical protein